MRTILESISKRSIEMNAWATQGKTLTGNWLGERPALDEDILNAESRLGIKLPEDYREFLLITNGFVGPSDVEPSFLKVQQIDYLHKLIPEINEVYQIKELERAILIGGMEEEQQFLLLPPDLTHQKWRYWKFANWIPGEEAYEDLRDYFNQVNEFLMESE